MTIGIGHPVRYRVDARQCPVRHGLRNLTMLCVLAAFLGTAAFGADTPVVIKLWNTEITQKKFYQQIFKDFNKANPDIKVEYTAQTSNEVMTKALDDAFRAGDLPDLFPAVVPWGEAPCPGSVAKNVELGLLTPLGLVAPSKQALAAWMAKFPQEKQHFVENRNVFNGKVYSWPDFLNVFPGPLYYNVKLFREAGLKGAEGKAAAPEIWDDLRMFAKKITQMGQGKVYGIVENKWLDSLYLIPAYAGWSDFGFNS